MLLGVLLVAVAAALFGTLSYVSRSAAAAGLEALPFVAWRAMAGAVALMAMSMLVGGRLGGGRLPDLGVLSRDRRVALLVAALFGALLNIAVFAAFLRTTVAVALICFYTFPAIVTLAAVRFYGERLDRVRIGALVLSSAGLGLVVLAPLIGSASVVVDPIGVALALIGAVCQAAFVLIAGRGFRPMPVLHVSTIVIFAALLVSLPLALIAGEVEGLLRPLSEPDVWLWILAGGVAGAAIPTTAFVTGIGLIGPSRAAILMTVEPLVGVTLAGLLLGERPSALQLVGGAAVLIAAAVLQVAPRAPHVAAESEYGHVV